METKINLWESNEGETVIWEKLKNLELYINVSRGGFFCKMALISQKESFLDNLCIKKGLFKLKYGIGH